MAGHTLITGGLGAIGIATVRRLVSAGGDVTVVDLPDAATGRAQLDEAALTTTDYFQADLRHRSQVEAALESAWPFDAVIGLAGIAVTARFEVITSDDWQRHLDVNLTGNFNLAQSAVRMMIDAERAGKLVFVSSWIGQRPWPETTAYSVSKAGLEMLTRCVALECADRGITANAVAPGILDAGMANEEALANEEYAERILRAVPVGRLQTTSDVAGLLEFLVSGAADYITGAVIVADGGNSLVTGGGWR